jgi:transcriptional/translational regulatory protein YebC/TACO1
MGAQWKAPLKAAAAAKKGAVIGKLTKELIVAAKLGGADPASNFRLRGAIEDARKASVPRDTIERSIKRGAGLLDDPIVYETILYEGFAPHQVPLIVECLTENRNRTAADMRVKFRKGQLGSSGSVAWMFDRKGVVEAHHAETGIDIESAAIEAGADEVIALKPSEGQPSTGTLARFTCAFTELDHVNKTLTSLNWNVLNSELSYIAKNNVELNPEQTKEVGDFLGEMDDHDDVHRIYVALKSQD